MTAFLSSKSKVSLWFPTLLEKSAGLPIPALPFAVSPRLPPFILSLEGRLSALREALGNGTPDRTRTCINRRSKRRALPLDYRGKFGATGGI